MAEEPSPYDAPNEPDHPWWAPTSPAPILVWASAGGAGGSAVGVTLHVTGSVPDLAGRLGTLGLVGMGLAGMVAVALERAHSRNRPPIPGPDGLPTRPVHEAVYLPALAVLVPSLVLLAVTVSVAMDTLMPAAVFLGGLWGVVLGVRRLWGSHRNRQALEALARGQVEPARLAWTALADNRWLRTRTRQQARISLGGLALEREDAATAEAWFRQSGSGALALAGLAMALVKQGRVEQGAAVLERAQGAKDRSQAQAWIDLTRVALVREADGEEAAHRLAQRLGHA